MNPTVKTEEPRSEPEEEVADFEVPGPPGDRPTEDLDPAIEAVQATVNEGIAQLLEAFDSKLALDTSKDRQIDRLHDELQGYKRDLVGQIRRPWIQGLVRLHDDLGKVVAALRQRPPETLAPGRFFRAFDGFADDIELLLGQQGVEAFEAPGECFDPQRQTALKTEFTNDPDRVGSIAQRLRPGFSEGARLLQKERVAVYAAPAKTETPVSVDPLATASCQAGEVSPATEVEAALGRPDHAVD